MQNIKQQNATDSLARFREDYLKPLGMTPHALPTVLHVSPARVNDIVLERLGITPNTVLRLARYFKGDA